MTNQTCNCFSLKSDFNLIWIVICHCRLLCLIMLFLIHFDLLSNTLSFYTSLSYLLWILANFLGKTIHLYTVCYINYMQKCIISLYKYLHKPIILLGRKCSNHLYLVQTLSMYSLVIASNISLYFIIIWLLSTLYLLTECLSLANTFRNVVCSHHQLLSSTY